MATRLSAAAVYGVDAQKIDVEVECTDAGMTQENSKRFFVVGLPDNAVKESQHRVESAIRTYEYYFPRNKVVVNLAPADVRKEGSCFDLPVALGIMAATHQLEPERMDGYLIMGELALNGEVRPIKGVLPIAIEARRLGMKGFILPKENAEEAAIVNNLEVIGVGTLEEAVNYLRGELAIQPVTRNTRELFAQAQDENEPDFSAVQGQENIKRALEIAAAGSHNVIMIGPPGAGKTMLAKRLPGILPPLTLVESLETTKIHSVAGRLGKLGSLVQTRPFRSPHHTISNVALVGGGNIPQPGEISLAHNGVLFLDELPEFQRTVLEVMRQPLEERKVCIARAKVSVDFPANFMLVASMNPCPCGYYNHPEKECSCPPGSVQKYLSKVSGPLLDRIDLHVEVTPVRFDEMVRERPAETSRSVRERVVTARQIQSDRFKASPGVYSNAMMDTPLVKLHCPIDEQGKTMLKRAMDRLGLSARAYDRILKVARTIADLDASPAIQPQHLAEAIQYRSLDRSSWGERR